MPTITREEIRFGGLIVRYLVEPQASGDSVAMFEFEVAPGAKVPIPHSHDAYEETLYGLEGVLTFTLNRQRMSSALATPSSSLAARSTVSTTSTPPLPRSSSSSPRAFSAQPISAKSPPSSAPPPAAHPTPPPSAKSCTATA